MHMEQLAIQQQQAQQQLLVQAKQQAVAKSWQLLAEFVMLNPCPWPALGTLPHDDPFLCIEADDQLCLSPRLSSWLTDHGAAAAAFACVFHGRLCWQLLHFAWIVRGHLCLHSILLTWYIFHINRQ